MECDEVRYALAESPERLSEAVVGHLAGCANCRAWQGRVNRLTRAALRPVAENRVVLTDDMVPAHFNRNWWLRMVLGWAAIILVVWNVPGVLELGADKATIHISRHQAAFGMALGLAFGFVALRPDRAYGMVPFAVTFTLALGLSAIVDLVNGASTPLKESHHIVELAGLAVLWVLGVGAGPSAKGSSPPR